ncbi:hypothetical protein PC121_g7103 [Phytophthora cactorum]|nr:hypothetical protein PC121_g7103 [Phytophthora cactorum]
MPRHPNQQDLPPHGKVAVALHLAQRSVGGRLPQGSITAAAAGFGLHRHTISKVWRQRHNSSVLLGSRQQRPLLPRRLTDDEVVERVRDAPLSQRQSLRSLAAATGIPKTTLLRYLKRSVICRKVSRVRPTLLAAHEMRRLSWALAHVERHIGAKMFRVHHMYDTVHLDEKWFNLYKANAKYYLAKDEELPYRSCPNKRYTGKAVAQQRSKKRAKGDPITKNVSMTRAVYTKMLREKVFPAIREKWSGKKSTTIKVQQDNAGPHVQDDNADIIEAGQEGGWDIQMVSQPPRSPDMDVLDLGFFNSLQSLQHKTPTFDTDGLFAAVEASFAKAGSRTLDKCFLTLQKVLGTAIACKGGNNYSLPRVRKCHIRNGISPIALPVDDSVVAEGYRHLRQLQLTA